MCFLRSATSLDLGLMTPQYAGIDIHWRDPRPQHSNEGIDEMPVEDWQMTVLR